jgi:hypothetical protein
MPTKDIEAEFMRVQWVKKQRIDKFAAVKLDWENFTELKAFILEKLL